MQMQSKHHLLELLTAAIILYTELKLSNRGKDERLGSIRFGSHVLHSLWLAFSYFIFFSRARCNECALVVSAIPVVKCEGVLTNCS